eukprot:m.255905 g.255905  ORF g.255905 m.255905 type:complete len:194 (-) comp19623_c0_seq24:350-931(-)
MDGTVNGTLHCRRATCSNRETLFWSLFGFVELDVLDAAGAPHSTTTEAVGRLLFGIYMVLVAILMINLLIAMMNSTYQRISDNADIEWKFFRGKLLAGYEDIPAAPAPFNIVIDFFHLVLTLLGFKLQYKSQITADMKAEEFTQMLKLTRNLAERYAADAPNKAIAPNTDSSADTVRTLHEQIKVGAKHDMIV